MKGGIYKNEKVDCQECNGTGEISTCCNVPINTTNHGRRCSKCNKFTKTSLCIKCDGSGVIRNIKTLIKEDNVVEEETPKRTFIGKIREFFVGV